MRFLRLQLETGNFMAYVFFPVLLFFGVFKVLLLFWLSSGFMVHQFTMRFVAVTVLQDAVNLVVFYRMYFLFFVWFSSFSSLGGFVRRCIS